MKRKEKKKRPQLFSTHSGGTYGTWQGSFSRAACLQFGTGAIAGMRAGVCFCAFLLMCTKETEECGSMQTRAPAFMFISLSGEGGCLCQEVWDVSPSQCLHVYVWVRLKGDSSWWESFSVFKRKRCYMLSLTGGGNDSHFLLFLFLFLLTARLLLLQIHSLLIFFFSIPAEGAEHCWSGHTVK